LQTILPALPRALPVPIVVVLHLLPGRPSGIADLLSASSGHLVKEADDKEPLCPGVVYVGSPNYHLLVEKGRHFSLSVDAPVHFSRPAIDVMFESAADVFGQALVGVLLSGANEDGARGLSRIHGAGGTTVVQRPEGAVAPQMPEAALRLAPADHVATVAEIGPLLGRLVNSEGSMSSLVTKERG
jgi:two-component system chemotaxis response regulator CheB